MILITQLFLSLQSHPDANVMDFFQFENQREPQSLADQGSLQYETKSDIFQCFNAPTGHAAAAKEATVVVLDMAAVIHMVHPTNVKTFSEYVWIHSLRKITSRLSHSNNAGKAHGQELVMAALQSQRVNGIVAS